MEYSPSQLKNLLYNFPGIKLNSISKNRYCEKSTPDDSVNGYRFSFSINNKVIISQLIPTNKINNCNLSEYGYIHTNKFYHILNDTEKNKINNSGSLPLFYLKFNRLLEILSYIINNINI